MAPRALSAQERRDRTRERVRQHRLRTLQQNQAQCIQECSHDPNTRLVDNPLLSTPSLHATITGIIPSA